MKPASTITITVPASPIIASPDDAIVAIIAMELMSAGTVSGLYALGSDALDRAGEDVTHREYFEALTNAAHDIAGEHFEGGPSDDSVYLTRDYDVFWVFVEAARNGLKVAREYSIFTGDV